MFLYEVNYFLNIIIYGLILKINKDPCIIIQYHIVWTISIMLYVSDIKGIQYYVIIHDLFYYYILLRKLSTWKIHVVKTLFGIYYWLYAIQIYHNNVGDTIYSYRAILHKTFVNICIYQTEYLIFKLWNAYTAVLNPWNLTRCSTCFQGQKMVGIFTLNVVVCRELTVRGRYLAAWEQSKEKKLENLFLNIRSWNMISFHHLNVLFFLKLYYIFYFWGTGNLFLENMIFRKRICFYCLITVIRSPLL